MPSNKIIIIICICLGFLTGTVSARVDREIAKEVARKYEDKVYFLRVDLRSSEEDEFITDMEDFIYEDIEEEDTPLIRFEKGERIVIKKVDFDAKEIEVDFFALENETEGELTFTFGERLSEDFDESPLFAKRFEEIFLRESLKERIESTDSISNQISRGNVFIGQTRDDLLLTLGEPFDIVKEVSDNETEEFIYRTDDRTYRFLFLNGLLREWIEH